MYDITLETSRQFINEVRREERVCWFASTWTLCRNVYELGVGGLDSVQGLVYSVF